MMKVYVRSLALPKGFPINEYQNLDELRKDGGDVIVEYNGVKIDAVTASVNSYLHQKGALVEGRDNLATWVGAVAKFPMLTKKATKTVDGKTIEMTVPAETEGKYLERFIAALATNAFKTNALMVTGTEPAARETSAWAAIQALVEKPLTITLEGKSVVLFDLRNDIKRPVHVSKPKTPPAYALDAAGNIIANKSEKKWTKVFTDEGVSFDSFVEPNDPEGNRVRLAWAIQAREQAKAKKEYA